MKVIINTCYGGASLSAEALKRAVLEGATSLTVSDRKNWNTFGGGFAPIGEGFEAATGTLSGGVVFRENKVYTCHFDSQDSRTDPILVQIVEEMGRAADGRCAHLRVVVVPDDVEWKIDEYDGIEHVAEVHRTWS